MDPIDRRSDARSMTIAATPAQVFAAIRDPDRLARWWGPDGFTSTIHAFECHPGGRWQLTLHGPDGAAFLNEYRVLRLESDRLIELDHPSDDHHFTLTIELQETIGGTVIAWWQTFDSIKEFEPLADFLAQANAQVLSRLAAEVGRHSAPAVQA